MLRIDASVSPEKFLYDRIRPPAWTIALLLSSLIAVLISLARSTPPYFSPALTRVEIAPGAGAAPPADAKAWRSYLWWRAPYTPGPHWVRFSLDRRKLGLEAPALALSGTFSATVWVNGRYAGSKGVPGNTSMQEKPGLVDAVIPLDRLTAGRNDVLMKMSGFHAGYSPKYLLNTLGLREYSNDPRRSPQRYLIAVTQTGLLAAFGIFFFRRFRQDFRRRAALWAAAASVAVLLAFAAESSRVLVNYPYSFQGMRLFATWLMLTGFGIFLNLFILDRFTATPTFFRTACVFVVVLIIALSGTDFRTASGVVCLIIAAIAALLNDGGEGRHEARKLAAWLIPWPIFAVLDSAQFLDNGIYVAASLILLYVAGNLLPRLDAAAPAISESGAISAALCLEDQTIPISMLRAAHAAGNYTELEFLDGSRRLFRVALRSLFETPPYLLMRVHRSHAVNIERVQRLRVERGSRYHLELDNGCRLPVSRSAARAIRAALSVRTSEDSVSDP